MTPFKQNKKEMSVYQAAPDPYQSDCVNIDWRSDSEVAPHFS